MSFPTCRMSRNSDPAPGEVPRPRPSTDIPGPFPCRYRSKDRKPPNRTDTEPMLRSDRYCTTFGKSPAHDTRKPERYWLAEVEAAVPADVEVREVLGDAAVREVPGDA